MVPGTESMPAAEAAEPSGRPPGDGDVVHRSLQGLAECLACDMCHGILQDPITAPECMHTYCRDCIEPAVLNPAGHNVCPACAREGTETFLGRNPFAMQRLQPDFNVDAIIRKLLPPDVRWHLDRMQCKFAPGTRQDRLASLQAAKPQQSKLQQPTSRTKGAAIQMSPSEALSLYISPESKEPHARQWILEQPYLRVPRAMPIAILPKYLSPRLGVPSGCIEMLHKGASLPQGRTVEEVVTAFAPTCKEGGGIFEMTFSVTQPAGNAEEQVA